MTDIKIITKVERIECPYLRGALFETKNKIFINTPIEFENLCISKNAKLIVEQKKNDKNTVFEHKLVFKSIKDNEHDGKHYAYRITVADGHQFLLGSDVRPYPICSESVIMSTTATDDMLMESTVTWTVTHRMYLIYIK